jgi:DNA end-binding protein Ku
MSPREALTMPAAVIWKGVLEFDDVRVPVRFHSAIEDRGIHFHLLHDQDSVRVKQRLASGKSGKTVTMEDALRGVEVERGRFVVVDDEELESLKPAPSRTIEITRFVPARQIDHQWYDRPYYLSPDGDADGYFALAAALESQEAQGIARWVMRQRRYVGALLAEDGYLLMQTLRHAGEVIPANQLEAPEGRKFEALELRMAKRLVSSLEGSFNPKEYRDEYRDQVAELIEAKLGRPLPFKEDDAPAKGGSLSDLLRASLKVRKG